MQAYVTDRKTSWEKVIWKLKLPSLHKDFDKNFKEFSKMAGMTWCNQVD